MQILEASSIEMLYVGYPRYQYVAVDCEDSIPNGGNAFPFAISPNRAELLIGSFDAEIEQALWILPLPGGAPRRLGDLRAHDAAWSPDGKRIAYASGQDLFIAGEDGGTSHKLVTVSDRAWWPRRKV